MLVVSSSVALSVTVAVGRTGADGWADIGSSGRPAWVPASVERRLQLLSALPAMHNAIQAEANAYFRGGGPGLVVGLVLDDGLVYSEGFGFADAGRTSRPDENTAFRAGSLSPRHKPASASCRTAHQVDRRACANDASLNASVIGHPTPNIGRWCATSRSFPRRHEELLLLANRPGLETYQTLAWRNSFPAPESRPGQ
jgi:hypothetical protein